MCHGAASVAAFVAIAGWLRERGQQVLLCQQQTQTPLLDLAQPAIAQLLERGALSLPALLAVAAAAWALARLVGRDAAAEALHYVAPVGEKGEYVARALGNIEPYLQRG